MTPFLAKARFIPDPRDFGNFRALQLLWPPSRRHKVERFVKDYTEECNRLRSSTPSIVAHSNGTYIAGEAMLKYPQIKFDRMILCGAILGTDCPWDDLAKNGRVTAVLNQYGGQDFWAWVVAWVVGDAGQSGRYGFRSQATCLTQQKYPQFRHSDYFYDLNYTQNWLPFLKGEEIEPPPIEEAKQANWRFRSILIVLLALAALVLYLRRGCTPFHVSAGRALERHIVDASATLPPASLQPLDRVLDDIETPPPGTV